jgi:hypothetical protein
MHCCSDSCSTHLLLLLLLPLLLLLLSLLLLLLLLPGRPVDDYNRLLHVVIVGGGPTGVEVAGELSNLINRDLKHIYPDRAKAMR